MKIQPKAEMKILNLKKSRTVLSTRQIPLWRTYPKILPGESSENGDMSFSDIADCTFRGSESLLGIPDDQLVQRGGGEPDFDIRLLQERKLIPLGVKDVSYELTFNDRILNDNKRMVDM